MTQVNAGGPGGGSDHGNTGAATLLVTRTHAQNFVQLSEGKVKPATIPTSHAIDHPCKALQTQGREIGSITWELSSSPGGISDA